VAKSNVDPLDDIRVKLAKLGERVTALEKDMHWLRDGLERLETRLEKVDNRAWYILGSVLLGIVITILAALI